MIEEAMSKPAIAARQVTEEANPGAVLLNHLRKTRLEGMGEGKAVAQKKAENFLACPALFEKLQFSSC